MLAANSQTTFPAVNLLRIQVTKPMCAKRMQKRKPSGRAMLERDTDLNLNLVKEPQGLIQNDAGLCEILPGRGRTYFSFPRLFSKKKKKGNKDILNVKIND